MCPVLTREEGYHFYRDLGFSAELEKQEADVGLKLADDTKSR